MLRELDEATKNKHKIAKTSEDIDFASRYREKSSENNS